MGDIRCRICGEPWDSYGVHHGDMTIAEKETFLKGKGCPCCHGKPIYDCELEKTLILGKPACEYFDSGRCIYDKKCDHKVRRVGNMEHFFSDLTDPLNTDDDPINLLSNVENLSDE